MPRPKEHLAVFSLWNGPTALFTLPTTGLETRRATKALQALASLLSQTKDRAVLEGSLAAATNSQRRFQ